MHPKFGTANHIFNIAQKRQNIILKRIHISKQCTNNASVTTEFVKYGSYFVEKRKEKGNLLHKTNKKAFTALNWLCKQEVAKKN